MGLVAVAALVLGTVLLLMLQRERSRTAAEPPAATSGRSERAAEPAAPSPAPRRAD
jgi:hypothetical protein